MKQDQYLSHCISGLFGSVLFSLATLVYANPGGPQIVHGQVTMSHPDPATLNIRNSPNAIINWKSFSIGKGETTRFIQQNASSAILNRVRGENPSALLGRMSSNGRVFLINPNGMVFGPNAVIDTAGFIGSTLNIKDDDFLAGRLNFEGAPGAGSIKNQGLIQARDDGGVYLIAPSIENSGIISTESGNLVLAAGRKITISSLDLEHISVEIQAPEDEVVNIGKLLTSGGAMGVFAGTIRNHGHIEADTLTRDAQGNIRLVAQADIELESGSTISASGPRGGRIHIESKTGTTQVSGAVEARGLVENGGEVQVLGEHVALNNTSNVDVSGERGGGTVLVGGDYKGQGEVRNATTTYVGPEATIDASAQTEGDGGKVIVWADDSTRYYGDTTVRGGTRGGDGGFVEVSGKRNLGFNGSVDAGASEGNVGTLLLDPLDIVIFDATGSEVAPEDDSQLEPDVPNPGDPEGQILAGDGDDPEDVFFISEQALEDLPGNIDIILEATNDITIEDMFNQILELNATNDGSVTFTADADLDGNGTFSTTFLNTIQTQGGAITIEGASIAPQNIDTNGPTGAESINSGAVTITSNGDSQLIISGDIDTSSTAGDGGDITISAAGNIFTSNLTSSGFSKAGNISLESTNGDIFITEEFGGPTVDATSSNGAGGNIRLTAAEVGTNGIINASGQTKSGDITLTGNEINLTGSNVQSDGGNLLLQPALDTQNVIVAGTTDNEDILDITTGDLDSLADNFNTVTIGRDDGLGVLTIAPNEITFNNQLVFQSPGASGRIEAAGSVLTDGSDLEMIAGDSIALQGDIETQGGDINLFSTGNINGLNLNASSDSSTGGDMSINGNQIGLSGTVQTKSADITLTASEMNLTGFVESSGPEGNISVNGPVQTSGNDLKMTAGDNIAITEDIISSGGNIDLSSTNIGLVTATLDSTNPDSGSGAINVAPTAGGSINIDNSTLITDSLTLGGPVAGTSSLTLLPATTGMDIDIGSTTPGSLLSIDNIGNLSEFSGHLSVGGTIAPPASSTQVKAGDMTVVSDFSMKGDLTLVSLGDITLNADGSLQSGGTLTLAALGDFIPGSPGNISDTSISEARLFFDAPEVVFFANNEAGTLENPLTVKSGANTVNAGAGTGVAYFDGAPGNIIGSGPVIQSLFNSLQAIDINLDNDILNTRVVDLSVPPSPAPPPPEPSPTELVPPTSYPQPYLFPFREPDIAKSATSRWNSEVNQVAMLDQWLELGPMFRNVVDMSRFNMDVLMAPSSTMVMSFRSDNNSINIGTTLAGDNMPTQPLQAQLTTASDGSIVAAIDMPDNLGATSGEVAMVNISIDVTDSSGNPAPIRISRIGLLPNTNTPGHTEADLREFGYEITNISFGPPEIIRPSDGQDTNYSFYSRAEFKRASVDFWRINPSRQHISENVDQQLIPERIRKGVWIGKDGSRHWNGLNWKEQPSIGQHELQIKAWNREGILWYIGRSDSRVTVSNGD